MKKRFLSTLLALCIVLTLLPSSVFAANDIIASGECGAEGANVTWTLDSGGVLTISGEGEMKDFGPINLSGDTDVPWESRRTEITTVKVNSGVTSIGKYAFYRCGGIRSIDIPDSMKRIGKDAFRDCAKLESVCIPDSVISVEEHAFVNCASLVNVDISKNLLNIESGVFAECTSLTNLTIPSKVTIIGDSAFSGCTSLTSIIVPENVTSIGDSAFFSCRNLRNIILPDGLLSIGPTAFYSCSALTQIDIPNSVTTIETDAFWNCSSLTSVTIPSGVTNLGNNVFRDCDELVNVVFEEGVTDISYGMFEHCDKLASVSIPSSVTTIGYAAFTNCSSLTSITIPSGVRNIDDIPFYFCEGLTEIVVDKDNTAYTAVDGVLFTKDLTTLVAYPIGNTRVTYTIPDNVVEINRGAFLHCTNLTRINIPISVTIVDCDATSECWNLKDVYYAGTREQWGEIQFLDHPTGDHPTSDVLRNATLHCIDDLYAVTYDANGGTGTMDDTQVNTGETFVFPACGFAAPTGKEFKAWQINGQEYAPGSTYTVTADTTVTAVWQTISPVGYTLTGTITGHKGVTYTSVTAQLVGLNGSTYSAEVGKGVTDNTGKTDYSYTVTAPAGQYTLEVEARTDQGGVVNRTAVVKLTGNGQTKDINLPNGQAKAKVENKVKTAALVGGLEELIIDADGEVTGEVTLTIDSVDKSSPDAAAIQSAASGQTLEFMDISITKSENGVESAVTDTGDVTVEIVLAFDCTGKSDIAVYRYHDGSVDTLTTQASGDGEKIEIDDDSITIYAKEFSVYAIGYIVSATNPDTPSRPTTPSRPSSSSTSSRYSISIPASIIGGTVTAQPTSATAGRKVTITAKPNSGYEMGTVTVADKSGNEITVTDAGDGKYTFIMPKRRVDVKVEFVRQQTMPSFTDVQSDAYYANAVFWAVEKGIITGTSDTAFSPDVTCTQGQILTFLWRAKGEPAPAGAVSGDEYYAEAAQWAAEQGLTDDFSAEADCTRAMVVTYLWKLAGSPKAASSSSFTDVPDALADAVSWAAEQGITTGTSETTFSPDATCTRGQIVTFLYRDMA